MAVIGVPSTRTPCFARTPRVVEREAAVERGLPAERQQDRVDLLLDDDLLDELGQSPRRGRSGRPVSLLVWIVAMFGLTRTVCDAFLLAAP